MSEGSRTPEELSTLLEDALIVGDVREVEPLFETVAVLINGDPTTETRGAQAIATAMVDEWSHSRLRVDTPRLVLRSNDLALTLGTAVHVLRRGPDQTWRYALSVMDPYQRHENPVGQAGRDHTRSPASPAKRGSSGEGLVREPDR